MVNEKSDIDASYLYENDFEDYRPLFIKYCPPPFPMPKGSLVYEKGVSKGWMYYLYGGIVKVFTSNYDGSERMLAYLKKDNIIGIDCFDPKSTAIVSAQCITDVWCTPFNCDTLQLMTNESPDFGFKLIAYYSKVMRQLCFDAENQSINELVTRMANFLYLYVINSVSDIVDMTQQDLASAISCSRSSVSRICDRFRQEGIVCSNGKGLRVSNLQKLKAYCRF